ncbi:MULTISPECIES: hypothetical protein [unclassified Mesorhizobium]|uniref:phage adaptor protein n=1 Tax=unclassified Mesorhizobium TaxID=325217 RepID=UPI00112EBD66|nr:MULTISPECIES: hypothetical protein [unclassified Mesorhizobium]MCA0000958.1 hypothetical protein [Mesorhizobium sp. B264B2A]MCA0004707.1 hypothetical protein [Mesorhizobium sp. B264B1B]MCA0019094.1 hypothetical protein [Mesorhizobium sp. B264B1A]TPJ38187.1 hypothetical protein FJ437_30895 [Mesorhizobium sp. B2-6-6]
MTILTVIQQAAMPVGLDKPLAVFTNTDREWQEMQVVANEAATVIAEAFDWQKLRKIATVTGDAVAEGFDLPTDYGRMLATSSLWSSRFTWDMQHVVSSDDWLGMEVWPATPIYGRWTIFSNQIHILPVMAVSETAKFFYIQNQIVSGGQTEFLTDTDTFVLSERLLKLAIIYLWKQSKGQDFAAELSDYEIALAQEMDKDGGSKPVVSGNSCGRSFRRTNVWPGTVTG